MLTRTSISPVVFAMILAGVPAYGQRVEAIRLEGNTEILRVEPGSRDLPGDPPVKASAVEGKEQITTGTKVEGEFFPAENLSLQLEDVLANHMNVVFQVKKPEEEILGTTLQPVDKLFRAQIDIPEDRGLIVGGIEPPSPAARIGLHPNDILLTLNEKPLSKFEDVIEALKNPGDAKELPLKLLRKGKNLTIMVRPVSMVTFGAVEKMNTTYFIGVAVNPLDPVLSDQLPEKIQGLMATDVIKGKPADKVGLQVGDILVSINGEPLKTVTDLTEKLQTSKGKQVSLAFRRRTRMIVADITPEVRETPVEDASQAWRLYTLGKMAHPRMFQPNMLAYSQPPIAAPTTTANIIQAQPSDPRVESLEAEVKALRKAIEELRDLIKNKK